jgi:hypothetical protein
MVEMSLAFNSQAKVIIYGGSERNSIFPTVRGVKHCMVRISTFSTAGQIRPQTAKTTREKYESEGINLVISFVHGLGE